MSDPVKMSNFKEQLKYIVTEIGKDACTSGVSMGIIVDGGVVGAQPEGEFPSKPKRTPGKYVLSGIKASSFCPWRS